MTTHKVRVQPDPTKYGYPDSTALNAVMEILNHLLPHNMAGQIEPKATIVRKGMIAYADGTNWNPGSGQGVYYYNGSVWVLLETGAGASGGTPALVMGTSNSAGTSGNFIRIDDGIALFDATVPSTQAFGDSAATGSAAYAARRDHKHAMMADPTDTEQAITCADSVTIDFNSGRQAYMVFDRATVAITLSNGVNGKVYRIRLTQDGTGGRTATWSTSVNWKGGSTPVLTTTLNKSDWITLVRSNGAWYGDIIKNF